MDGKELNTRELEGSIANTLQKVRFLHAAQSDLNVRRKNSLYQTPSSIRKAENEVLYHERRLGGVLEELIEEAKKLLQNIDPGESAPIKRFASRGD